MSGDEAVVLALFAHAKRSGSHACKADASIRENVVLQENFVMVSTVRFYHDAIIAVALMAVLAIVCGFIAAVITGGSSANFPVAAIAFLLTGAYLFSRLWQISRRPLLPQSNA